MWCSDGAFYRGDPLEVVPKDHVTLRIHDGKSVRIEWSKITGIDGLPVGPIDRKPPAAVHRVEVDEDENDEHAASLKPNRTTGPRAAEKNIQVQSAQQTEPESVVSMPLYPGNKPVQVRFTGMRQGAMIEYLAHSTEINAWSWPVGAIGGTADTWKGLCALPCRLTADRERLMRISGPNITTSSAFLLPKRGDRFEIEIKPGWDTTRTAAWVLFGVGAGIAAIGSIVIAAVQSNSSDYSQSNFMIGGGVLAGAGALTMLISAPVFAKSKTDVDIYRE